jgi:hypothetical protein
MRNGRYIVAIGLILAIFCAAEAPAAGGFEAHARPPAYDTATLELNGVGAYRTAAKHHQLRVTVCLRKRYRGRFFDVRCATATGSGRRVKGQVAVPGCVTGVWRTTAVGEALGPGGGWIDQASAVSRRFRCP